MSIRLRLAAMFAIATMIVSIVGGLIFMGSLEADLRASLDTSLRARADELVQAVRESTSGVDFREEASSKILPARDAVRQLLDPAGRVVESSQHLGTTPIVAISRARSSNAGYWFTNASIAGDPHRVLSADVLRRDGHWTVIVASSIDPLDVAVGRVRRSLIIGSVIATVLAALSSWLLARSTLRPVEIMRRTAAEISAHDVAGELHVPNTNDEVAALAVTMNDLLHRLRGALQRQQAFVADAGHELRTPLAILRTELELADQPNRSRDELFEAIRNAGAETERISKLAEELLFLARADSEPSVENHANESIIAIVRLSVTNFEHVAETVGVRIVTEGDPDIVASVDAVSLRRAIDNLVGNALRFAPRDTTVTIRVTETAGEVEVSVADQGPGFPPAFLPSAFERFSRASGSRDRHQGGSGIGLSIVHAVAQQHHGTAHADNLPRSGARVTVTLAKRS